MRLILSLTEVCSNYTYPAEVAPASLIEERFSNWLIHNPDIDFKKYSTNVLFLSVSVTVFF